VFLEQFPLTASGKVNRRALPKPMRNAQRELTAAPPRNPLEEKILALYKDIFGIEQIGIHDHFFRDLGGHSLLATRLASRIRTRLDIEIPLQVLFEAPTTAMLAEVIGHFESRL
jgi:acyl carrier protein